MGELWRILATIRVPLEIQEKRSATALFHAIEWLYAAHSKTSSDYTEGRMNLILEKTDQVDYFAPYVEGNPSYWIGEECGPQLDGALFEIACWDSSGTILINLPVQAAQSFVTIFTDTRPLATARV